MCTPSMVKMRQIASTFPNFFLGFHPGPSDNAVIDFLSFCSLEGEPHTSRLQTVFLNNSLVCLDSLGVMRYDYWIFQREWHWPDVGNVAFRMSFSSYASISPSCPASLMNDSLIAALHCLSSSVELPNLSFCYR